MPSSATGVSTFSRSAGWSRRVSRPPTASGSTWRAPSRRTAHPFRVAIVCAMWLAGFDVKSLATLYLDKPLKAHTLMQAIARANRVHEGKNNGLIVDYGGILRNLRSTLPPSPGTQEWKTGANRILPPSPRRSCSTNWPSPSKRYARFSPRRRSGRKRSSRRTASSGTRPSPPPRRWSTRTTRRGNASRSWPVPCSGSSGCLPIKAVPRSPKRL